MRRLFGTIGLTCLGVSAVAFYLNSLRVHIALAVAAAFVLAAGVLLKKEQRKYAWTVIAAGGAALLGVAAIFLYQNIIYQPKVDNYSDKEISFEGYVCDEIRLGMKTVFVPIQTETVDGREESLKINLTLYSEKEISEFDKVRGRLRLYREVRKNEISRGWWFNAFQDDELRIERTGESHFTLYRYAVDARKMINRLADDLLPRSCAALCKAVVLGERFALSKETKHDISRTGTSFLIVVSGMHLSVICGFIASILRRLRLKRLPMFLTVCVLVVCFTALTGFSRSVIRAGVMTMITYGAPILRRKSDGVNSLGAAGLALTALNPFSAGDIGVIMSFVSTLGILLWARHIDNWLIDFFRIRRIKQRWLRRAPMAVTNLISVSVSASLWMIPVCTFFFQRIPPLVIPVSILTEPIVCLVLILMLIITALYFIPVLTLLTKPLAWALTLLCRMFLSIIAFFAALPYSSVNIRHLYFYLWLAFTVALVVTAYLIRAKKRVIGAFILLSASVLGMGWSVHTLISANTAELWISQTNRGVTVALSKGNSLSLLACGGNGGYNSDVLDTLYSYSDRIDTLIIPNRINYSSYFAMLDAHFDIDDIFVNSKYRDELGLTDCEAIEDSTRFAIEARGGTIEVIDVDDIVYQYVTAGDETILFVPHYADIEKLPEEYRTADTVIMDYVSEHAELLRCGRLIYTGQQNSRWEKHRGELRDICETLTPLLNGSCILQIK